MGQFAVFEDGVGFAVQGVVFDAGFITADADFEDAVGKFGSRGDFLAVGDELGGVDFAVFYGFSFCRNGRFVTVGFGVCIGDVDGRHGDFVPLAAFFDEGGDDLLVGLIAQGQAAFGLVGIGDFEGNDDVVFFVDGFAFIVFGRNVFVIRVGRIVRFVRNVGDHGFVRHFRSVECIYGHSG